MKKLLLIIITISLLTCLLYAEKKEKRTERTVFDTNPNRNQVTSPVLSRDIFDLQFQIDVSETIAQGIAGAEYDGEYFYVTEWGYAGTTIHILDIDGNEVGSFIPSFVTGTGIRDMAWDGSYFYGSNASNTIYCFETDGTLVTTIASPAAVRAIAYDEGQDAFWINNWAEDLRLIDRSGNQIDTITTPPSMYGCAYDGFSQGGPYLWIFTGTTTGGGCQLEQYDLATGILTGVTHQVEADGIAGGLFIADGIIPGKATIGALAQGTFLYGYELCDTAPLNSPGVPTDVTVTPDVGGALEADIDWICPDVTVNGDPLTDLDEMRVYRDGDLIYTDTLPVIGEAGSYYDAVVPVADMVSYAVVGFNDEGEGIPVVVTVWVGGDVPAAVTDLVLEDISTDTELLAHLSWINPTEGLHGGAFVDPILGYHVLRSDGVDFELNGILTEWTDDTIPVIDYYSYSIVPFNSIGDGGSATSNTSLITTANVIFADDFSGGIDNWVVVINSGVGEWIIYDEPYPNSYTMPENSIPPLIAADSDEAGSGTTTDTDLILAIPLDCSGMIDVILDFDSDFNMINDDDYAYVDVSSNGGDTWNNVLIYNGVDVPATHEMINITEFAAGFGEVLIKFHSVQPGWDWWWAIDNVMVSGTEGELGSIIGTVTDASNTNPIDGAIVTYSGTTQVTDLNGDYEFPTVLPGTHTLTCTADGYYEGEEEVVVIGGETAICNFAMDPNLFGILDGTVTDADTGDPLIGAEINAISLGGYEYDAVTDNDGYYEIIDVVAEAYDVYCSFPDYPTEIVEDVVIEDGITTTVNFSLEGYTFWNDFETNDGGLVSSSVWDWGAFTSGPMSGYSGTNGWATSISGNYPNGANSTLDTPTSYLIGSPVAMLEFWHWYNIENSYDGGNVKISIDGGSSWSVIVPLTGYTGSANTSNPLSGEEIFCGITTDWEFLQFDLSGYVGQSIILRWHFGSDSSVQYPGWYIDDVAISGGGPPADPGYIEGTVVIADGAGDVEDVEVEAGGVIVNPVADGTYSIEIQPGTYDVTATLDGYDTGFIEDVLVTEGNATTGVDFSLVTDGDEIIVVATKLDNNYPNPFNPETIINYSIKEAGNVTIEVYNIKGQLVKILVNDTQETGNYTTIWNGRDNSNKSVASGVYFYKMRAQNYSSTKKMILMK
ncbi:MAG: carboxypeptidase regulatory-like domain-containing protein [Candidatus Cloacimonadota bacterium]|nr:carboxypeptidase regulatory-like domain-containing protein [Candidatus Cloacimonadota bacterium]